MRRLETLFLATLALGGVRTLITPNLVFLCQFAALNFLILAKLYSKDFLPVRSPIVLLLPLTFVLYFSFRSAGALAAGDIVAADVTATLKHIAVVCSLSLALFRFRLTEDFFSDGQTFVLVRLIVVLGALSTGYILSLHLLTFRIGRLEDGLYFSTFYVFSIFLLSAFVLSGQKLFSSKIDFLILLPLAVRLFVDLRRTPVIVVSLFVVVFVIVIFVRKLLKKEHKTRRSTLQKLLLACVVLTIAVGVYQIVSSGVFSRLNVEALRFALFDIRLVDIMIAVETTMDMNPIFGLGPTYSPDLVTSEQVHSLPGAIFLGYGGIGLLLFIWLVARITFGALELSVRQRGANPSYIYLIASSLYVIFFTFSARGFEIEVFSLLAIALVIRAQRA